MYYAEIQGEMMGFSTKKTRDLILKIAKAARKYKRVRIGYLKKKTQRLVFRDIAPYECTRWLLYLTDKRKGIGCIRGYTVDNIKTAKVLKIGFRPQWEVRL